MANAKLQVFDDFKKFATMFRGFHDIAEELGKIGSLEQAGDEAKARLDKLRGEEANWHSAADKIVADAKSEADKIKRAADGEAINTRSAAQHTLDDARREAERIVAEGKAKDSKTHLEALGLLEGVKSQHAAALKQLEAVNADHAGKIKELNELQSAVADAKAEHERVIAAHREFLSRVGVAR